MNDKIYSFIVNKEHHKYRHTVDWNLGEEYSKKVCHRQNVWQTDLKKCATKKER